MLNNREKVLVVCMLDSIHSARWLTLFKDQEIDFYLFPSTPNRKIHKQLKSLIKGSPKCNANFRLANPVARFSIVIWFLGLVSSNLLPAFLLKRIVIKEEIQKIHAIELNHAGYLVQKACSLGLPKNTKIISTNWGSDIYWFQRYPKHLKKIKKVLEVTDFYSAECTRDIDLAHKYGYRGLVNDVYPNTGGFSLSEILAKSIPTSSRKSIVVKGYESFVGRASIALAAVAECADLLSDYEIHVYSANRKTKQIVSKLRKETKLKFFIYGKKSLTHNQVLDLFRKSRIYIGVSLSDAISTSLLEAIVCGAYPIQTDTSCAKEWIKNDISGGIVKPEVSSVKYVLEQALINDYLVDRAAELNHETAVGRLDIEKISKKLENFYFKVS